MLMQYYKQQILAGKDADVIVFETMTDLYELKAAVLAAKENCDKPILTTMTFERNGRTFTGVSPACAAVTLTGLGVDALGVNCSLGPDELEPVVSEMSKYTNLPLVIKANAGLPDPNSNEYNIMPDKFAECVCSLLKYGVKVIGGCCGTNPDYIAKIKSEVADREYQPQTKSVDTTVCSSTTVVEINGPRIIGERINPTGKKLFKQALVENNIDYILTQALSQVQGGAEILDVNVGLPGIDEREMMIDTIKSLQAVVDVPLQIDSTIPEVLEAALRVYNGKPLVNSVNGEEESLNNVLPLVKKYGAGVIGLALDKDGIPKKAEDRVAIAKKIMDRAVAMGIPKEDIYIDCLTLTASAEQEGVMETLNALHTVKNELGLKTVLGVSNISFGLPNRVLVNHIFLTMALTNGLDLAIINPNIPEMTGAVRAYKLLANIDKNSVDYYIEELKADHEKEVNELKANVNKLSEAVLSLKTMREVNLTESNKTIDGLKAKNAEYESEIESLKEQVNAYKQKEFESAGRYESISRTLLEARESADALIAQTNKECEAQHAEMTAKCEAMEKDTTDRCNALETETNAKCKQMYDETEATCASLKEQAYNDSERTRNKAHEAAES